MTHFVAEKQIQYGILIFDQTYHSSIALIYRTDESTEDFQARYIVSHKPKLGERTARVIRFNGDNTKILNNRPATDQEFQALEGRIVQEKQKNFFRHIKKLGEGHYKCQAYTTISYQVQGLGTDKAKWSVSNTSLKRQMTSLEIAHFKTMMGLEIKEILSHF